MDRLKRQIVLASSTVGSVTLLKRRSKIGIAVLIVASATVLGISSLVLAQTPAPAAHPTPDMLTVAAGFSGAAGGQGAAPATLPDNVVGPAADPTADVPTVVSGFSGAAGGQGAAPAPAALPGNVVGPAGGRITSPSGRMVLDVPAGALAADTEITITELEAGEGPTVGPVFDLQPEGLQFAQPATLMIRYTPDDVPEGYNIEDIAITQVAPDGEEQGGQFTDLALAEEAQGSPMVPFPFLDTTVDPQAGTASTAIDHFSRFGLRYYSSFTISDALVGEAKAQVLAGPFDYGNEGESATGAGAAYAAYVLPGFLQVQAAVPVGSEGSATAGAAMVKWFYVKESPLGTTATKNGLVLVDIDHNGLIGDGSNNYHAVITVQCLDGDWYLRGAPMHLGDSEAGIEMRTGQFAQSYNMYPTGSPTTDYPFGPPYSPGWLEVQFTDLELIARHWYAVGVFLAGWVHGWPPEENLPAAGGSIEWSGSSQFLVLRVQVSNLD
jgi:hypothetical protein